MYNLTNCLDTLFIYFEEKKKHAHEQISIQQNVLETKP